MDRAGGGVTDHGGPAPATSALFSLTRTARTSVFSKYKLAKAFLRWLGTHDWADLTATEQAAWTSLVTAVNKALV